jgi:outer membrane protein assembly factor BamD (BamD/ComL family)
MKKIYVLICLLSFVIAGITGCKSVPTEEEISQELSAAELIQLAQTSYDNSNTAASEVYYQVLVNRYGDDIANRITGEFELAHIKIKQKKWAEALPMLNKILGYYDALDSYLLPQEYKKLVTIDLAKIPETYLNPVSTDEPVE